MERLFSSEGDECLRFELPLDGLTWAQIAAAMLDADFGTAIGYADGGGELRTNPRADTMVRGNALFLVVDERQKPTQEGIARRLASVTRAA